MRVARRDLLLSVVVAELAAACAPISQRVEPTAEPASSPEIDAWRGEAVSILSDALATLRTFEVFAAYRVSVTQSSSQRLPNGLAWDPPTGAAWDDATRISHGVHDRANQLFEAITRTSLDAPLWRAQRTVADVTHDLADLGDALQAYRDRVGQLPPGDATGSLDLLDRAWARWDTIAARWSMTRGEPIACTG